MTSNQLLTVNRLNLDFFSTAKTIRILTNVSLNVMKGESVGLMGETGCGKTLTTRSIIGLLPKTMKPSGEIMFDGKDLLNGTGSEILELRRRRIALVPQNAMTSIDPLFSIRQHMYEIIGSRVDKKEKERRSKEALASVELDPERVLDAKSYELSGGMQQRAVIAMALVRDPELIIADEFTSALDVETQRKLLSLMNKLRRDRNLSMIVVTHDMAVASDLCDRVAVMYLGRVIEMGNVKDIVTNPKHPYTKALLLATPRVGGNSPTAIRGSVPNLGDMPDGCKFNPRCPYVMDICRKTEPTLISSEKSLVACHLFNESGELRNG
jgi:peptide/nickel transport system ATP-binding protein